MVSLKRMIFIIIMVLSSKVLYSILQNLLILNKCSGLEEVLYEGERNATKLKPTSRLSSRIIITTTQSATTPSATTSGKPKEELLGWRQRIPWKSKLDQHEYRYLINPEKVCEKSANITLVVLIKTRMEARNQRDIIRKTYGQGVVKYNVSAIIIFLVGTTKETTTTKQAWLQEEAAYFGDILQEDFIDSYHNLTIKLIMGFKWASSFCTNSQYVMSTDDDVAVDIVNLTNDLGSLSSEFRSNLAVADPAIRWHPARDIISKWYTPLSFYSKDIWPPFPRGYAYIVSKDVGYKIYRESQKFAPVAPWDDVYCGFLLQRLGIEMKDMGAWFKNRHGKQVAPYPWLLNNYAIMEFGGYPKEKLWHAIEDRYKILPTASDNVILENGTSYPRTH